MRSEKNAIRYTYFSKQAIYAIWGYVSSKQAIDYNNPHNWTLFIQYTLWQGTLKYDLAPKKLNTEHPQAAKPVIHAALPLSFTVEFPYFWIGHPFNFVLSGKNCIYGFLPKQLTVDHSMYTMWVLLQPNTLARKIHKIGSPRAPSSGRRSPSIRAKYRSYIYVRLMWTEAKREE